MSRTVWPGVDPSSSEYYWITPISIKMSPSHSFVVCEMRGPAWMSFMVPHNWRLSDSRVNSACLIGSEL